MDNEKLSVYFFKLRKGKRISIFFHSEQLLYEQRKNHFKNLIRFIKEYIKTKTTVSQERDNIKTYLRINQKTVPKEQQTKKDNNGKRYTATKQIGKNVKYRKINKVVIKLKKC